jgi:hypothetical protein
MLMDDGMNAILTLAAIALFLSYSKSSYVEFEMPLGYQDGLDKFNRYNK